MGWLDPVFREASLTRSVLVLCASGASARGMGMSWTRIGTPERRDRMFLMAALAQGLLTLLGEAGERAGLDRVLKTNTSKERQLSLKRQGLLWYERIPMMPEERLHTLMRHFGSMLLEHRAYRVTGCLHIRDTPASG
jgi:hypothetical protein